MRTFESHFIIFIKTTGMPGEEGPRGPRALDGCNGTDGMQGTPGYAGPPGKRIIMGSIFCVKNLNL